jgi:Tol biopolymer transport system component
VLREVEVARTIVVLGAFLLSLAGGAGGAMRSGSGGMVVFSSFLPEYPLPNNFQVDRTFVVQQHGHAHELATDARISPDGLRVATVRSGSELWVSGLDGSSARRVAAGSSAISDVSWSTSGSALAFVAGGVWVVGADGSGLHEVFDSPAAKAALPASGAWAPNDAHLIAFAGDDLWLLAADGSSQRMIFQPASTPAWADESVEGIDWAPRTSALAVTIGTSAGCGPGIYENCFDWYVVTYDRSGNRLATFGSALDAAWSPDGTRLAYETGPFLLDPESVVVETARADGSDTRKLTRRAHKTWGSDCWAYPTWIDAATVAVEEASDCPDASEVAFDVIRERDDKVLYRSRGRDETFAADGAYGAFLRRVHGHTGLYTLDLASTPPRAREEAVPADTPMWSPDGSKLAFTRISSRYRDLEVLTVPGEATQRATRIEVGRTLEPTWYGGRLVYSSQLPPSPKPLLWTVRPDGTGLRRLPNGSGGVDPAWSPDGRRIAFAADGVRIETIRPNGSGLAHIAVGTQHWYMNPAWSPDGTEIAYSRTSLGLYLVSANGGTSQRLVEVPAGAETTLSPQAWSPDGRRIAYERDGDLTIANADGSGATTLLGPCCAPPSWSPDGSKLAFSCSSCVNGGSGIAVMNADGSGLRGVVADLHGDTLGYPDIEAPTWSPDGRELVFSGTSCTSAADPKTGPPAICIVLPDGTGLRQISPPGVAAFAPSWTATDN